MFHNKIQDINTKNDTGEEIVDTEDIENIERELDDMLKQHKETNTKLEDIICEENFNKKKEFREKEREK